jgi:hypothetical protein
MYDTFMLITGIIFIVLTIFVVFMFAVAFAVAKAAVHERKLYRNGYRKLLIMHTEYKKAIERSNELEVEKFRHELDCHQNTI